MRALPRTVTLLLAAAAPMAAFGAFLAPSDAEACGGTFCDGPPPLPPGTPPPDPMPVDQTGETLVFVVDGDTVEAHIRIEVDPESEATTFAWIIPVTATPTFQISNDKFFEKMQETTVPVYGFSSWQDTCGGTGGSSGGSSGGWCDGGDTGGTEDSSGGFEGDDDSGMSGEPEVVSHENVGAFEIFVLDGGTVAGVMQWLTDNNFDPNPEAEPILGEYLMEGHQFVAMRLNRGESTSAVHPIALRYPGIEPCIPLRLTAIAAKQDMDIRAMFLGNERFGPTNWAHVVRNEVQVNWLEVGSNYKDVISMAVDEDMADGLAFTTEYAGPSSIVDQDGIIDPLWDPSAFAAAELDEVWDLVQAQGFVDECDTEACTFTHPLIQSILEKHLPVPDMVNPVDLYECPECFAGLLPDWDGPAFAADLQDRIVGPAERSVELLQTYPYLTRMYTTISPEEMIEDPMFHSNPDLPDVALPGFGQRNQYCDFSYDFDIANGRTLALQGEQSWPSIDGMPWAERIEMIPAAGPPQVIVDNGEVIDDLVAQWNSANGHVQRNHDPCSEDDHGEDDGFEDDGWDAGEEGSEASSGPGQSEDDKPFQSCNCDLDGRSGGVLPLAMLGLLGLGRRRRRR